MALADPTIVLACQGVRGGCVPFRSSLEPSQGCVRSRMRVCVAGLLLVGALLAVPSDGARRKSKREPSSAAPPSGGSANAAAEGPNARFGAAKSLLRQLKQSTGDDERNEIADRAERMFDEVFEEVGALPGDRRDTQIDLLMQTAAEFGKVGLNAQRHRTLRRVAQVGDELLSMANVPVGTQIKLNKALTSVAKSLDSDFDDPESGEQAYAALLKPYPSQIDPLGELRLQTPSGEKDEPEGSRPAGETSARIKTHRALSNLLQRQGRLSEATYHLASAVRLEVTQLNETTSKGIIGLANLLGAGSSGHAAVTTMGRACNFKNCGDDDGKPSSWQAASGWTFSSGIVDLATDRNLQMQAASEDAVTQWHSTDGRRSCRAWRGAVPDGVKQMLSDHMREGPYLADRYSQVANPAYQSGQSEDAGYVSWWAPLSDKDAPPNVLSQIAYEWVLPLLPPSTLKLMEAGGGGVEHW